MSDQGRVDKKSGVLLDGKKRVEKASEKDDVFLLKIYSPFKVYFDGEAVSISAENFTGPFDILAHHHNFMTLVNPCELYIRTRTGDQRIRIARGIMHVKSDEVNLFLDV